MPYPPTFEELRQKALVFFKENKPKSYRQMKRDNELDEVLDMRARACQRYAQGLMEQGMWEGEAWNLAIRQEILESETD